MAVSAGGPVENFDHAVLPKKIEPILLPMCPAPHEPDVQYQATL